MDGEQQKEKTIKDNFKNSICYVPGIAIVLYMYKGDKTKQLEKNITYGIYLLVIFFILSFFITIFMSYLAIFFIVFMIYIIISTYYGYLAYKGEDINIYLLDKLIEKIDNTR
ncbi:MAG: hypothetical protein PHN31_01405 [Candidatus Gracilibacteria bacterium]|nr:hypothetical protein [Candidatus Gracilibacteria bacterium]